MDEEIPLPKIDEAASAVDELLNKYHLIWNDEQARSAVRTVITLLSNFIHLCVIRWIWI